LVRNKLLIFGYRRIVETAPDQTLDRKKGVLRVGNGLALGWQADQHFIVVGECHLAATRGTGIDTLLDAVEFALEPVVNDVPGGDAPDRPAFSLTQNHPNPFNPATQISFSLPEAQTVRLSIYTVDGRKVATLLSADLPAGAHSVIWDGKNDRDQKMASGTYFYNIEAGPYSLTKRMMLVK